MVRLLFNDALRLFVCQNDAMLNMLGMCCCLRRLGLALRALGRRPLLHHEQEGRGGQSDAVRELYTAVHEH